MENKNTELSELRVIMGDMSKGERLIIFKKEKGGYVATNSIGIVSPVSQIKSSLNENDPHSKTYPYLVVRIISGCYQIFPLPEGLAEEELLAVAIERGKSSHLRVCLVLSASRSFYVELGGAVSMSASIPSGGTVLY